MNWAQSKRSISCIALYTTNLEKGSYSLQNFLGAQSEDFKIRWLLAIMDRFVTYQIASNGLVFDSEQCQLPEVF